MRIRVICLFLSLTAKTSRASNGETLFHSQPRQSLCLIFHCIFFFSSSTLSFLFLFLLFSSSLVLFLYFSFSFLSSTPLVLPLLTFSAPQQSLLLPSLLLFFLHSPLNGPFSFSSGKIAGSINGSPESRSSKTSFTYKTC